MRFLTQAADRQVELLMQLFQIQARNVVHLHILEAMPASLVPRVQVGGVARQRPLGRTRCSGRTSTSAFDRDRQDNRWTATLQTERCLANASERHRETWITTHYLPSMNPKICRQSLCRDSGRLSFR